tara:strand:+ start:16700 stop:17122 length:423 start_codon:yes stop_codon:yes gene_type:complete
MTGNYVGIKSVGDLVNSPQGFDIEFTERVDITQAAGKVVGRFRSFYLDGRSDELFLDGDELSSRAPYQRDGGEWAQIITQGRGMPDLELIAKTPEDLQTTYFVEAVHDGVPIADFRDYIEANPIPAHLIPKPEQQPSATE